MAAAPPPLDPGWGGPRNFLLMLVPILNRALVRTSDGLVLTRQLFVAFSGSLVWVGVILLLLDLGGSNDGSIEVSTATVVVGLSGIAALAAAVRLSSRPLNCTSPTTLVGSYRSRFFLRLAFSEFSMLLGFVLVFIAANPLPYFVGATFTALGFAWLAPTKAKLARDQEQLVTAGCGIDLVSALRGSAA
jgi:hypothetical protein